MVDLQPEEHTTSDLLAVATAALQAAYTRVSGAMDPDADRSGEDLDAATVLRQVGDLHELINIASAVQTHRLAEHAASETLVTYDPEADTRDYTLRRGPVGRVRDTAAADLQGLLSLGPVSARQLLSRAVESVAFFPQLVDAMATGSVSRAQVDAVGDALVDVEPPHRRATAEAVEHELLLRGIEDLPPTRLRKVAKTVVYAARPEAEPVARERETRERLGVWFSPGPIAGLSVMSATLRTQDAVTIQHALEALAWRYHTAARKEADAERAERAASGAEQSGNEPIGAGSGARADDAQATGDDAPLAADCGCCPREQGRQPCCGSDGFASTHDSDCDPAQRAANERADADSDIPVGALGGEADRPKLGECRTEALRDLLLANADVETVATLLVPIVPFPVASPDPEPPAAAGRCPVPPDPVPPDLRALAPPPLQPKLSVDPDDPSPDDALCDELSDLLPPDRVPETVPRAWMQAVAARMSDTGPDPSPAEASLIGALERLGVPTESPGSHGGARPVPAPEPVRPPSSGYDVAFARCTVLLRPAVAVAPADEPAELREELPDAPADELAEPADELTEPADELPPIREVVRRPGCLDQVEIPGLGVIPADVVTAMVRAGGLSLRRVLVDTTTGVLLTGPSPTRTPYRPSEALAEAIRLRDGTCRFPGCARPATHTDIDHVNPYDPDDPAAQTVGSNLQCLCRAHHRAKQSGAWTVTMTPDGICTWTSITGEQRFTYPQHLDLLDAPPPF